MPPKEARHCFTVPQTPRDIIMLEESFPLLKRSVNQRPLIYFDNAATTQKPQVVIDSLVNYYSHQCSNVHRGAHTLSNEATELFEQARKMVASFIQANPNNVIWTRGTTESLNLACYSYVEHIIEANDEILISGMEHHANLVPWQQIAFKKQAKLIVCPLTENGDLDIEAYKHCLNERTKCVAINHASNVSGSINPVKQLTQLAKSHNACVVIDGAQAVPHIAVDVPDIGCDFYAFSGHKLFGPDGIGVLWASDSLLKKMKPWQFGGEMVAHVSYEHTSFQQNQLKFEAGSPNVSDALGLAAACGWLQSQDQHALEAYENHLLNTLLQKLKALPFIRLIAKPSQQIPLVSFSVSGWDSSDVGAYLDTQGIAVRTGKHCAHPFYETRGIKESVRVSLAFYNTEAQIDELIRCLNNMMDDNVQASTSTTACSNNRRWDFVTPYLNAIEASPSWQTKQREIMLLGKIAFDFPEQLKTPLTKVTGCDSDTWVYVDNQTTPMDIFVDSKARIIKGLLALVAHHFETTQRLTEDEAHQFFETLGIQNKLNPSRANGLNHAIQAICKTDSNTR